MIIDQLLSYPCSPKCTNAHTSTDTYSILNEKIPGYRKGHLTTTLLLRFRDDIIQAMKRDEIMPVFPDLSKAFDTVDHTRILEKMHKWVTCVKNDSLHE